MIIIILMFPLIHAQWLLLEKDSPELLTTETNAQCSGRTDSALWCDGDDLFMFGGFDGITEKSDMWKYETETRRWLWQPDPPITMKASQGMSYWSIAGELWMYGGYSAVHGVSHDMWSYEPNSRKWAIVVPQNLGPGERYGSAFWTHKSTNNLYLYGGYKASNESYADLWSYNIQSGRWSIIQTGGERPGPRIHAKAVLGHSEDTVYLFGGSQVDNGLTIGKMRQLDLTTMTWSISPIDNGVGPTGRSKHIMWMTPTQDKVTIFGGHSGSALLKDLWFYNHELEHWVQDDKSAGPSARYGSSYCTDDRGDLYMFGGSFEDPKYTRSDVWKHGPLSSTNIFQLIDFKLDAVTLAAILGATMSTILAVGFFFVLLCMCVKKFRQHQYSPAKQYLAQQISVEQL